MAELSADTSVSHYRIVSRIGAGSMGEVYLAQDTKLDRKVALKILPADLAANRDRMQRFVREAKSAAALNHPNIAHIYEIGESNGVNFIAMEFIDGHTFGEVIQSETDLRKLVRYLQHVVEGLCCRHCPPGSQTRQHHGDARWSRKDSGLRHCEIERFTNPLKHVE